MDPFQSEFEHQFILQAIGDAIIAVDLDRRILWVNPAFVRLFGYSSGEMVSKPIALLYANPVDYEEQGKLRYSRNSPSDSHPYEMQYRKKDGSTFWGEAHGAVVINEREERIGFTVSIRDITRQKQLIHDLHLEKEQWFVTLKSIGDAVITTDEHCRITYLNPLAEEMTGWGSDEAMGHPIAQVFQIVNEYTGAPGDNPVERALKEGVVVELANHTLLIRRDGKKFSIEDSAAPIRDDEEKVRGCVIIFRDVTEKRRLEQKISYQANYDALTGLPNRHLFQDRVTQAIAQAHRTGRLFALLYVDVDHFKNINDRLGHPFGDRVLVELGRRFTSIVRESDTIARIGGDEFAIILGDLSDQTEALVLGHRLLNESVTPFRIDDSRADLTVSIGVTLFPDDGTDMTSLVRNADIALYQVKKTGRNNIQFFSQEMNRIVQKRLKIATELQDALDQNQFFLHYQPIVDYAQSRAIGVEALVRWKHRNKTRHPDEFIPVAEEMGLIVPLGRWVLQSALQQMRIWIDQGFLLNRLAVNVAVKQIHSAGFVDFLEYLLKENRIDPALLELEITERTLMFQDHHTLETLSRIRDLGVSISVDDFGTGYSSLNYIRNFPVNTLKIDRSFLTGLFNNHYDQAIVLAILAMAKSLSLDVVAEGVEQEEQDRFLRNNGCYLAQGYYYGHPVSPEKVQPLFDRIAQNPPHKIP
ncbi:putative bifunctional diguanylate cyclase/phosphodiesterase [Leptospirillum ferrooxidans]|uniref:putative bifunctional diguanylate cyclase/phosphodiesterase n=1 Tax=Leptospirillum ferrooxidans TaxID=180 RepID=UPI0002E50575|nr:bifunctional diguanylate cyclase/phosphodiesterase [Leptospirillum ferrooxidans]